MNAWFAVAAVVLIVELFAGTVYLLVVSAALFGAGLVAGLTGNDDAATLAAAALSALGIWLVHGRLKRRRLPSVEDGVPDDLDVGQIVRVRRHLYGNMYEVFYRGAHWQAQLSGGRDVQAVSDAVITGKNGNVLLIQLC